MKISEHIGNTLEAWSEAWKDRLRGWMGSWLDFGINVFFDRLGKAAAPMFKPLIDKIEERAEIPPELKPLFDEIKSPTGQAGAMLANSAGSAVLGSGIGRFMDIVLRPLMKAASLIPGFVLYEATELIALWRRGKITKETLTNLLRLHGLHPENQEELIELTKFIPYAAQIVEWVAKEVYEPGMVKKYGLMEEFPTKQMEDFDKVGVDEIQAEHFWTAHWEHPSWTQVTEMLHRGHLTPEDVFEWYRVVEIPPYWRNLLTKISYTPYTRVDARRMWDMGVLEDGPLLTAYKDIGYDEEHAANMVLWTKVYVTFPDLLARYRNGWIDKETVLSEIVALGMKPERAQWLFETKFKKVAAERTATERDLTRADFIKGIKKGVITVEEGKVLLMEMGYDAEEVDFIIAVHVETEGGSPANFAEYKRLSQLWRYSQGLPTRQTPAEIKAAERELAEKYPLKVPLTEEELKVKVDTIRRKRRNRQITRDQEIAGLLEQGLTVELATAYADNDDLRLHPEKESK